MSVDTGPPDEIHVRMYRALEPLDTLEPHYRGLLGDCFLIRLKRGRKQSTILIDCGILTGSPLAEARMQAIARDIATSCGGTLDLLVVTHEHWDHISGFSHARDILLSPENGLNIANIWMAWTEKPDDAQAQGLRERFDRTGATLAAVAERAAIDRLSLGIEEPRTVEELAAFLGPIGETQQQCRGKLGAAPSSFKRLKAREILDQLKKIREPDYLEPGDVLPTPGDVSMRAFVLGPPRREDRLFKDKPSADPARRETYFDMLMLDSATVEGYAGNLPPASPFAPGYCQLRWDGADGFGDQDSERRERWPDARLASAQWLRDAYFGLTDDTEKNEALRKRRIDMDWMAAAGSLALKLDADTNNTSLVLAFEYADGPDCPIMLFAADAQVGNWLSWHDRTYATGDRDVTAEDLLSRTRFYKVGHHGSHNATLAERGLKMMTDPQLVAAIPTDEALGKRQGRKGWRMPDPGVDAALHARTEGRILRNDRLYWPDSPEKRTDPALRNVDPAFFERITEDALFLEYRILPREMERWSTLPLPAA